MSLSLTELARMVEEEQEKVKGLESDMQEYEAKVKADAGDTDASSRYAQAKNDLDSAKRELEDAKDRLRRELN